MKTNEAPEKIYISYEGYGVFGEDGSTERTKNSQIEYTRTDAFIDKAVEWLKNSSYGYLTENWGEIELDREALAVDFANYMKGE